MTKAKDPVCGMTIEVNDSTPHTNYKGKDYYFCAPGCKTKFEENPSKYLENNNE